ncbi:MAG: hypothetical protein KGI24_06390 [Candidatus Omnitrophica bacterium]|nr:hypothetical protein [Candidatus Omnitrophota bacterium]
MRSILLVLFLIIAPCAGLGEERPLPPFYKTIMAIMAPLEYSGVPVMVKPHVSLSVDFGRRTWTLNNIHEYDSRGNIILAQGRFGLCAELATYLFEKIRPLLNSRYEVKFAMVAEPEFFSADRSNHIALLLADKAQGQIYLIDPSFHKYARLKDLPEYRVLNAQDTLAFVKDKSHDITFSVDQAIPLYIRKDCLLSFSVTSVDGKFDKDNFIFVISADRRGKPGGHDIVLIGRRNKKFEDLEDRPRLYRILTQEEIDVLFGKLKVWIRSIGP